MSNKPSRPLGSIAVDLGYASHEQVEETLQEQRNRESNGEKRVRIGKLMEETGVLTAVQLFQVLSQSGDLAALISEDAIRLAVRLSSSTSEDESVITVTAAANDEGVTTVATQLATALALMTQGDILLVDANIHDPRIHSNFDLKQTPGFTDIIEGRTDLDQACQRTEIPGLWVLPAGVYAADHLYTVMNEACTQVLMDLRNKTFRYIIIDTAPILGYSDTALMASRSDATIMVVQADKRSKAEVLEMKKILEGLQVNILGALLRK